MDGLGSLAADGGAAEPLLGVPLPSHGGVPHLHVAGGHRGVPLIGLVPLAVAGNKFMNLQSFFSQSE